MTRNGRTTAPRKRRWLWIAVVLSGGYVTYRVIYALGLMWGLWYPAAAKGKRLVMAEYPMDARLANAGSGPQQSPAEVVGRVRQDLARPEELKRQALEEAGGDPGKAVELLLGKSQTPDGSQALFEAMRELAPQTGEGQPVQVQPVQAPQVQAQQARAQAQPQFQARAGEPGIVHVAKAAQVLGERLKAPKVNPLDLLLVEEALGLMGRYGAPAHAQAPRATLVGEETKAPAIDPLVKTVLWAFMKSPEPYHQAMACRALGRLGDAETAEELTRHPDAYPWASLADFGPGALEQWKQKRLKMLRTGDASEGAAFWQGVRLTPQQQDVAVDLAMAGDGGAAMAMERNLAIEAGREPDPDVRMARYIDIALRFPGTRESFVAHSVISALGGIGDVLDLGDGAPKTREAFLRAYEHDLAIAFGGNPRWRDRDLVLYESAGVIAGLFHHRENDPERWERDHLAPFWDQVVAVFRKHYKQKIEREELEWKDESETNDDLRRLSLDARHLGLPPIDYPFRKVEAGGREYAHRIGLDKGPEKENPDWWGPRDYRVCLQKGHIKSMGDF